MVNVVYWTVFDVCCWFCSIASSLPLSVIDSVVASLGGTPLLPVVDWMVTVWGQAFSSRISATEWGNYLDVGVLSILSGLWLCSSCGAEKVLVLTRALSERRPPPRQIQSMSGSELRFRMTSKMYLGISLSKDTSAVTFLRSSNQFWRKDEQNCGKMPNLAVFRNFFWFSSRCGWHPKFNQLTSHRHVRGKIWSVVWRKCKCKGKGLRSPLRELTYHMGSHSVTCHPAEVTFPPLPQQRLVLDLAWCSCWQTDIQTTGKM